MGILKGNLDNFDPAWKDARIVGILRECAIGLKLPWQMKFLL